MPEEEPSPALKHSAPAGQPPISIQPAFIRIPKPGTRDPFSGLSRAHLFMLIKDGRVKSVSMRQPGAKRGVRLIDAASLVAAINAAGNS